MKYHNDIVDPTNLLKPITQVLDFKSSIISLDFYKKNNFYYTKSKLTTDLGFLVEDLSIQSFSQIEKIDVDFSNEKDAQTILFVDLFLTKLSLDYSWSYLKVQDIAATVGGFFSITYNFLKLINYFYIETNIMFYYFNNLFSFQSMNDTNSNNNSEKDKEYKDIEVIQSEEKDFNIIPFKNSEDKPNKLTI